MIIAIDPGHGGTDPGAQAGGLTEAELTHLFAGRLRNHAMADAFRVVMTRECVTEPRSGSTARSAVANEADAGCFVSLHLNAGPATARGAWVLYGRGKQRAEALARRIWDELVTVLDAVRSASPPHAVYSDESAWVGYTARARQVIDGRPPTQTAQQALDAAGIKMPWRRIGVLHEPAMPAVLVELGFITHDGDRHRLHVDYAWQDLLCRAIVNGVRTWMQ